MQEDKNLKETVTWKGQTYTLIADLNVFEAVQNKYGSLSKFGDLTDSEKSEVNIGACKFILKEMVNEGIDIENEEQHTARPFLTSNQIGRMLTDLSVEQISKKIQKTVIDSVNDDSKNA